MYCENCEIRVESEHSKITDPDEAERYYKWFDDEDVDGDYDISEVGEKRLVDNRDGSATQWQIALRVDTCVNCAVPQQARTYLHHWDT